MRSVIPNALTSLNLIFGVLSILSTIKADYSLAGIYIILAMIADALDGRAARYFGVSGDFGKELDSLCDLGSFGVAPAILIYQYSLSAIGNIAIAVILMFAVCGAMRLARFNVNVSTVQGFFMGMPIPAAGCMIATFVIADLQGLSSTIILYSVLMLGYLMVSSIKYPDFKGKGNPIKPVSAIITAFSMLYIVYLLGLENIYRTIPFLVFLSYSLLGIFNSVYCLIFAKR